MTKADFKAQLSTLYSVVGEFGGHKIERVAKV